MRMGFACAGLIVLTCLAGCGGPSGPKTAPVSGTLKIKGQAVEGVEVQFISEKFAAAGKTNAEGKFQLQPGAVPGRNKVCFRKFDSGQLKVDPQAGMDAGQFGAMTEAQGAKPTVKQLIPPQYSNAATTKVEFDVPAKGTTTANFDL
jgi:hypothetical protein